jgi:Ca-activated chloride channel homolog
MLIRTWILALAATLGLFAQATITPRAPAPHQANAETPLPKANIRADVNLVLVPVTVVDQLSRMVTGMQPENFQVFEDGVEQKLTSFGSEDAPLSIGIVLDTSGSVGRSFFIRGEAVSEFFKSANPEDEAFLVEFSSRPELTVPFTHDLGEIQNRLAFVKSHGLTALLDSLALADATMRKATHPRRAILMISDGEDNHSRYTEREIEKRLQESDVQIYSLGLGEYSWGKSLLGRFSELSGGRLFYPIYPGKMSDVMDKIAVELRNTYLLGYSPTNNSRDGKYRSIRVQVIPPRGLPKLKASWRRGYFEPTQ